MAIENFAVDLHVGPNSTFKKILESVCICNKIWNIFTVLIACCAVCVALTGVCSD